MFDLPPGYDSPPAVVVAHDQTASAGADDALTRSIREQIAAAYTAGALPDSSLLAELSAAGGTVVPPPGGNFSALTGGGPTVVPPNQN